MSPSQEFIYSAMSIYFFNSPFQTLLTQNKKWNKEKLYKLMKKETTYSEDIYNSTEALNFSSFFDRMEFFIRNKTIFFTFRFSANNVKKKIQSVFYEQTFRIFSTWAGKSESKRLYLIAKSFWQKWNSLFSIFQNI